MNLIRTGTTAFRLSCRNFEAIAKAQRDSWLRSRIPNRCVK